MAPQERPRFRTGKGVADFAEPSGTRPCRERDCERGNGVRCAYTAPDGRRCRTSWCVQHRRILGGVVYCRRHFNVLIALGESATDPLALPDLDNRGPSLVNWVHRDLDVGVRSILNRVPGGDGRAIRDPSVTVVFDGERRRYWERGWILQDGAEGRLHGVEVVVYDEDDAMVLVDVDGVTVARGIPPWIERHRRKIEVTAAVDQTQRRLFYSFLLEHLDRALAGVMV